MAIFQDSIRISLFWTRFIKITAQLLSALVLGLILSCAYIQHDAWFKTVVEKKIALLLSDSLKAQFTCKIKNIQLLSGIITCESITCEDTQNKSWKVTCPRISFNFSWLGILLRSRLEVGLKIYDLDIYSDISNNKISLVKAIQAYLETPVLIPFAFNSCGLRRARLTLADKEKGNKLICLFSSDTYSEQNQLKSSIAISDGLIRAYNRDYAQKLDGNISITSSQSKLIESAVFNLLFDYPHYSGDKQCTAMGNYQSDTGTLSVYNHDKTMFFNMTDISYQKKSAVFEIKIPLLEIARALHHDLSDLAGIATMRGNFLLSDKAILSTQGQAILENVKYKSIVLERALINFDMNLPDACGTYLIDCYNTQLAGKWHYNLYNKNGAMDFRNTKNIALPLGIYCKPASLVGKLQLNNHKNKQIDAKSSELINSGILDFTCHFMTRHNPHVLRGTVDFDQEKCMSKGILDQISYKAEALFADKIISFNGIESNKTVVDLKSQPETKKIAVFITDQYIKNIVNYCFGYSIIGDGSYEFIIDYKWPQVKINTYLKNGNIRIPYIYNTIISGACVTALDLQSKVITTKDLVLKLYKGAINCSQAIMYFNSDNSLSSMHMPFRIYQSAMSWKKDFMGIFTGNIIFTYQPLGQSTIMGQLFLDKSQLSSAVLSRKFQEDIIKNTLYSLNQAHTDINLNIQLNTREPIAAKTNILETHATADITLKGTILRPLFGGTIELQGGVLAFPYKPLYITQGKISLANIADPSIDLIAKNTISKYAISMHVSGTVSNPKISFESMPYLQEQQIMTLLFSGSEEGSCYLMMTPVIIKALESLIFNSDSNSSKLQRSLKNMLKPLKNIRIRPSLNKQTGAVTGGIEISVNDRIKALVQNNLNMSEKTELKLEYALSDEINILGKKDATGNMSGEIEMRWKF
jgi:hypothetical protein